ncbi:hypothetical protein M5K25_024590 [Dendrobium thyrsiflorum]|uniref:Uncharacterized protein n=1 Tax=Dendrobium thyrsiflorum TaxID=117978 RepID=A0ABD0U2S3_DENTH
MKATGKVEFSTIEERLRMKAGKEAERNRATGGWKKLRKATVVGCGSWRKEEMVVKWNPMHEALAFRSTNAPQQMWFASRANHTELPAIQPYLGVLDLTFYSHSGFRLEPWEMCLPMLNFLKLTELPAIRPYLGMLDPAFYTHSNLKLQAVERLQAVPAQFVRYAGKVVFRTDQENHLQSAIIASGDSSADSESSPRFTCSICDAMSGSDSSSFGKYRSSSELQSIGNTIIQASGASLLTYSSFTGILGTTEMTRHTSVGRRFASSSSSVPPILNSDIKSASLMGCLTNFGFSGFEELAWLRCCLEVDACTLGNPFRLSTGSLRDLLIFGPHLSPHLSPHVDEGSIFVIKEILLNFHLLSSWGAITSTGNGASLVLVLLQYALPYIRPPYLWCRSVLLVHIPYNTHLSNVLPPPLSYPLFLPLLVSGSLSDGATESLVLDLGRRLLRSVDYDRSWILPLEESANDGISWRILQGVDRQDKCHHGFSFRPIFDVAYWSRWISGKLHRMSRPFLFLFSHHLFEALASRLVFLSTGTFQWWIPEYAVRVSHPDVHRVGDPVGRVVVLAVTTETLPPVTTLLVAGASDWESLSKTEILRRGS